MHFQNLITIVPLSGPDPDPSDLTERAARATMDSFQVLWHPALLNRSNTLPAWVRAADPPVAAPGQLILVPEPSRRFLSHAWEDQARAGGARVIAGDECLDRFLARLRDELPSGFFDQPSDDVVADFFALGLARLWLEMLTAYMKHTSTLDDRFDKEVLAAASAAVVGEVATHQNHRDAAFQLLREAREQLYAAEIHLLDLVLVDPRAGLERLPQQLKLGRPLNLFLSGRTAEELRRRDPAAADALRLDLDSADVEIVGGEFDEVASTLLPLESHLWQFYRGEQAYRESLGRAPVVFGRRRFGLARHVWQLISRHEFASATHFCFDDGRVPDRPDAKVRWEAPDSGTVETLNRVPFAADRAIEFLKFPWRLSQTIARDFVATIGLVHWPAPEAHWYADLLRITRHAPIFGRFSTLSHYFQTTDPSSLSASALNDEYVSPFLAFAQQRGSRDPISSFARHHRLRARLDAVRSLTTIEQSIRACWTAQQPDLADVEYLLETDANDVSTRLNETEDSVTRRLAERLGCVSASALEETAGAERPASGVIVMNPLGFDRRVIVPLPSSGIRAATDETARAATRCVSVNVPGFGFQWVSSDGPASDPADGADVVVDGQTIRNGILEVEIDEATGGIRSLRHATTRFAQLGQQLTAVGVPTGRDPIYDPAYGPDGYTAAGAPAGPIKTTMQARRTTVVAAGPQLADVVVEGDLCASAGAADAGALRLAAFRQSYRLGRGQAVVLLTIEFTDLVDGALDGKSGPWQSYIASRFAWPDADAVLVRAVGTLPEPTRAPRPESPYFVEVHGRRTRTAILTGGLPFHQRVGGRMLDVLLVTPTETCRRFELGLGIDLSNPFQAALDLITPPAMIATDGGPPASGPAGWFFHLDARNVVVTSLAPLGGERRGVRLRLFETAGRYTRANLRCLRPVADAQTTDFHCQRLARLYPEGDVVPFDLAPREITQVEVEFA
jgi:alpha-mannosidase